MAATPNPPDTSGVTPTEFPVTTPPFVQTDHSFTLQAIMEIQRAVGELKSSVDSLAEDQREQRKSLDKIRYFLGAATAAAAIVGAFILYILDKEYDKIIDLLGK
ncbi:MAG: hypothetical protein MI806_08085 [Minwuiales bacterium]|nr:hypothetical protein [Minwuiales bacterium]